MDNSQNICHDSEFFAAKCNQYTAHLQTLT